MYTNEITARILQRALDEFFSKPDRMVLDAENMFETSSGTPSYARDGLQVYPGDRVCAVVALRQVTRALIAEDNAFGLRGRDYDDSTWRAMELIERETPHDTIIEVLRAEGPEGLATATRAALARLEAS